MDFLTSIFPPHDFALIALILGMPLLGAAVNGIWGKRLGNQAVRLMALVAIGVSFLGSVIAFISLDRVAGAEGHEHVKLVWNAWEWMHTSGASSPRSPNEVGTATIDVKFSVDALSAVMMLVITGVGFLIHLYASSYMPMDKAYPRFFAYLNLFVFSMLVLVMGDNLPLLFVGWEGVGLCSYLLIGFSYDKASAAAAGKKAFIANRIGDFGLICAMFLLSHYTGALDWSGMANGAQNLMNPGDPLHVWPIGGGTYGGFLSFLQPEKALTITGATGVGLALLLGCTGKSAQIPLYVWLPDAMAGPTPVSALIHAATMVTAGIYLICRMSFAFVLSPFTMTLIACIGAATAFFAATIALVQNDIKKVLAYSTVSQLGFMFLGVGVGAFTAGFFHVFTHAFFKACLFLGAGSVIHAMHGRIHDEEKSQDIRNMGGLRKFLPLTHLTFAASTAAIIGFPFTSGFFSKDEILYKTFVSHAKHPLSEMAALKKAGIWEPPGYIGQILYVVGVLAALMTAFYMCRLYFRTFWGEFRGWKIGRPSTLPKAEIEGDGHDDHHEEDLSTPGHAPHESPWQMTVPLIILAGFAVFAGVLNPGFHIFKTPPLEHWLHPVFEAAEKGSVTFTEGAEHMEWTLAIPGVLAFAIGSGLAYWMYVLQKGAPAAAIAKSVKPLHRLLLDKWRIDEFYDNTVIAAVDALSDFSAELDKWVVDGIIARASAVAVGAAGTILRAFQNGVVHVYAAMMVVGLVVIGWFFVAPHADITVTSVPNGDYTLVAGPGMGYAFRWDADGDGNLDTPTHGAQTEVKIHLEPEKSQVVRLEVRNAFGFTSSKEVTVTRPKNVEPVQKIELGLAPQPTREGNN